MPNGIGRERKSAKRKLGKGLTRLGKRVTVSKIAKIKSTTKIAKMRPTMKAKTQKRRR